MRLKLAIFSRESLWLGLALLFCVTASSAQVISSTVNGSVTDPSDAFVPGATVSLINLATGETYHASTNASGFYTIPFVKPGRYEQTVEAAGFKAYHGTGITLETAIAATLDIHLELGSNTESVTVEVAAPLLQSANSTVGTLIDNRTIADMPLINRRAAQLVKLSGFVVLVATSAKGGDAAIGGGRGGNTQWLVDGGSVTNWATDTTSSNYDPPIEALQEFKLSVSNYSAELGRSGGGVIQMTTKSGTNTFHGAAYEYLRNDKFDARTFFAAGKENLRYNLFGAAIGGPIRKNRTFFYFNYEGLRDDEHITRIVNVPTRAETQGNFSGNSAVVRDPATGMPFPGNIIPSSRLDPVGAKLAAFYPEPNVPGQPSRSSNYRNTQSNDLPNNNYLTRVDHAFNDNSRMFVRYIDYPDHQRLGTFYPTPGVSQYNGPDIDRHYRNVSGTWFHNFKPTVVNEFRFTWRNLRTLQIHRGADYGIAGQIGLTGVEEQFMPRINVTGIDALGHANRQYRLQDPKRTWDIVNNVSILRGNHSLRVGGEYRKEWMQDLFRGTAGGSFSFNNVATGDALASLLLGWVQSASRQDNLPIRSRSDTIGLYIQDDWKVAPSLTLNLGLRWDSDQPRREVLNNQQNSFDRNAINPVCNCPGVVTFSGRNGVPEAAHNRDWNNFGPRFGFAWRIGNHWVVRGGGAILYTPAYDASLSFDPSLGFGVNSSFVSPDNGRTAAFLLRNGLPPTPFPTDATRTASFGAVPIGQSPNTSVNFLEPGDRPTGYLETFNFNIEREITSNLMLEIGYLGTLGHKLAGNASQSIDQAPPSLMGPGNAQVLRPYPQFSDVRILSPTIGNSNYHAMNLKLEKRLSKGIHFQANYTWSKFIDDLPSRAELGGGSNGLANFYDRRDDRGLSGNDIEHRFVFSTVYGLPFKPANKVLNQVAGGWELGYIAELRSGSPYTVVENTNTTNAFTDVQRANVLADPKLSGDRSRAEQIARWFNTSAFAVPAPYTFGNAGRSVGFGPGAIAMDLSVLKDIGIRESQRLQFRMEMLNFLNHPNFGLPAASQGAANFGQIRTLAPGNQSRMIQFGLHYRF